MTTPPVPGMTRSIGQVPPGLIEPVKLILPVSAAKAALLARPKAMARRVFFIFHILRGW
ncbi:hypothetical protein D3C81_2147550 [compost metagenome]